MTKENAAAAIREGRAVLGIELGSTRIKAVLIGDDHLPLATGIYDWENRYENGVWTYHLDDVWAGIQASYRMLAQRVEEEYGTPLTALAALGFSAMMHGYLPFDAAGTQLAEFRTWRNTMTEPAAAKLTALLGFNIPQRWSIAHLYQAMLNGEEHLPRLAFLTTLAGYVHWRLTGRRVLGVGEASGMFPIDSDACDYDAAMVTKFDAEAARMGYDWQLRGLLPQVLAAGDDAGTLTAEGAKLLDPTGRLAAGIPLCPPEGDAGTGMVATNSITQRTGNVSAGTSIFAMIVLQKPLSRVYPEIDMVTTPAGRPVAMVHCNNCSSDIDAWAGLLRQFAEALGCPCSMPKALDTLFYAALEGEADCGGVLSYNYFSGEPVTGLDAGRPLLVRRPDVAFTFANFARAQLYGALATLRIGMQILLQREQVQVDALLGHGGFFKATGAGQRMLAAAMDTPVSVMPTSGEGGPWGMALLAAFAVRRSAGQTLEDYLALQVFAAQQVTTVAPLPQDVAGFASYLAAYEKGLAAERAAVEALR